MFLKFTLKVVHEIKEKYIQKFDLQFFTYYVFFLLNLSVSFCTFLAFQGICKSFFINTNHIHKNPKNALEVQTFSDRKTRKKNVEKISY